jgi:hypothetical protein
MKIVIFAELNFAVITFFMKILVTVFLNLRTYLCGPHV